jgi:hypothetical protein
MAVFQVFRGLRANFVDAGLTATLISTPRLIAW